MLINEWQLGTELNQALQQQRRADFQLWLSALSPAVEEQAEFCLADANATAKTADLRSQLQLMPLRDAAMQSGDAGLMLRQHQALLQGGFSALRLAALLQPAPVVVEHGAKKLDAGLKDNLSLHVLRHLQQAKCAESSSQGNRNSERHDGTDSAPAAGTTDSISVITPDPTLLYDMLQQLKQQPQAA